jgi:ribosomal protein L7/L12
MGSLRSLKRDSVVEVKEAQRRALIFRRELPARVSELLNWIARDKKIMAIKRFRQMTDTGLKESKEAIEEGKVWKEYFSKMTADEVLWRFDKAWDWTLEKFEAEYQEMERYILGEE